MVSTDILSGGQQLSLEGNEIVKQAPIFVIYRPLDSVTYEQL